MNGSDRGSALIWWVIILVIFFVVASVVAYLQFDEKERYIERYNHAQQEIARREELLGDRVKELSEFSQMVGWTGGVVGPGAKSNPASIIERISALKQKFPSQITASDTTLETALRGVEMAYDDLANRLKDSSANLEVALADAERAKESTRTVGAEKDQEIARLNASIREEQERAARSATTSTQTIEGLRNRITELEAAVQKSESDRKRDRNELENRVLAEQAKVQQLNERNKMIRERDVPDGRVIDATQRSGLAWIDVGARHGLVRGTRFNVFEMGKGGEKRPKGWIEVRELRDASALCGIVETADPVRPIVAGDLISNPYFDREKKPVFVFLGDLPGRYTKEEVSRMLTSKGAKVEDRVTAMTDFLVVGQAPQSETPIVLEDTPTFQLAREYGVQVMAASDLQKYIQY